MNKKWGFVIAMDIIDVLIKEGKIDMYMYVCIGEGKKRYISNM